MKNKKELPDYGSFPAPNGVLHLATEAQNPPFDYIDGENITGYEIDLAALFCEDYGYGLVVEDMIFDAILPSVQSGKFDFGCATISITEERRESVWFSEPDYSGGVVFAVRTDKPADDKGSSSIGSLLPGIYFSFSELSGKKIGIQTGTSFDQSVLNTITDAEIVYLNTKADLTNSLLTYKIDGFATDEPVAKTMMRSNDKLTCIPDYMEPFEFGYVFRKDETGEKLRSQFNEFLRQIKNDGTLEEIDARWFNKDETGKTIPDYRSLPAPNGTLRMATEALYEPFSYIAGNQIVGYDIDIAVRFSEAYGYGLEISDMSFDAVLPAVQTGKCNFGGAGITITAERAESVLFSEPNYAGGTVMMVLRDPDAPIPEFSTFSELNGKTISMLEGAPFEDMIKSKVQNPGGFTYYSNMPDLLLALKSGKTDAALSNNAVSRLGINLRKR